MDTFSSFPSSFPQFPALWKLDNWKTGKLDLDNPLRGGKLENYKEKNRDA